MEKFPTQAASAWFPLLPKGWAHSRIKYEVARIGSGGTPNTDDDLLWARDGSGTAWVSIADMSTTDIVNTTERRLTAAGLASKNLETFPPGTLLYSMYASVGKISILGASAAINQAMLAILPDAKKIDARFFRWALEYVSNRILELASTNTQDNLNLQKVRNAFLLRPPINLQAAIADFLDRETAGADALVVKYERLIELLEEKKVALVTQAVTKGLDPSVPMKDSGVEWIGEIPAHWHLSPLKYIIDVTSGSTPSKDKPEFWNGDVPWASAKDLKSDSIADTEDHVTHLAVTECGLRILPSLTILTVVRGMILARYLPVTITEQPMTINQDLKALRVYDRIEVLYLANFLRSKSSTIIAFADTAGHGTKVLRSEDWMNLPIPLPPKNEQRAIDDHILSQTQRVKEFKTKISLAMNIVREHRSALITAAVTGQIDVSTYRSKNQPIEIPE